MMHVIGGAQTYSKAPQRYPIGTLQTASRAHGAFVWNGAGDRWLDTVNALGTVILGHHYGPVVDAVRQQLDRGVAFSVATELEQQVADELEGIVPPYMDAVRFAKNGADVTGAAVRLARATTGREVVLMSSSGYHGHHEWCMTRPPMNSGVTEGMAALTKFYEHGDLESLERMLAYCQKEKWPVAAVVVEPVESGWPLDPPLDWWMQLKPLCDSYGAMLIFDEVVTGLRVPEFTYANWLYHMDAPGPDLLCLGKAVANGHPLSILVGPQHRLLRITEDVFFSTTHGGEALSLAAAAATLHEAKRLYLPEILAKAGRRFSNALQESAGKAGVGMEVLGYYARPFVAFDRKAQAEAFGRAMAQRHVLWQGYVNMSFDMADPRVLTALIERTQAAVEEVSE